ncbi:glyoxalase [Paractinoplanes deccanensis]|uniref:Glyoxalase n=1 Tax=Paractinoplanes deccanensis TaxID=113561 RepID=A0ABQ3Y2B7_9ACTN|nr:VOC family protein [Actinoplanes deccanensis]GID74134.1 glyoxalase [Actinoplanes deccanensis]
MTFAFECLHHVQVLCPPGGEDVARRFYSDVLGMTELAKPPALAARGGCWFRGGGWEVHVSPVPDFAPATRAHPGVRVSGLEGLAERLRTAGRPVEWDPHFPGHRRFYSRDDHGNRLEFLEAVRD